jgi:hypothetical protein
MTRPPRLSHPRPKVEPYSGQAHSLHGERVRRRAALKLKLSPPGGQQLGEGRLELPLVGKPAR